MFKSVFNPVFFIIVACSLNVSSVHAVSFKTCDIKRNDSCYSCLDNGGYDGIQTKEETFQSLEKSANASPSWWDNAFVLESGEVYVKMSDGSILQKETIKPKSILKASSSKLESVISNRNHQFNKDEFRKFRGRGFKETNESIYILKDPLETMLKKHDVKSQNFIYISVGGERTIQGYKFLKEKVKITKVLNFDLDEEVLEYVKSRLPSEVESSHYLLDLRNKATWEEILNSLKNDENVILDLSNTRQSDVANKSLEGLYPGDGLDNFITAVCSKIRPDGPSFKIEFTHSVWTVPDYRGGHEEDRSYYETEWLKNWGPKDKNFRSFSKFSFEDLNKFSPQQAPGYLVPIATSADLDWPSACETFGIFLHCPAFLHNELSYPRRHAYLLC